MKIIQVTSPIDDIRILQPTGGAVTIPARVVLQFRSRIIELEKELRELKDYAEGHHSQEEPHVWLHSLTVDIPSRIEQALERGLESGEE